ncbi:MAG TPA: hypothetical protein VFI47_23435 [Acidimicrobiales bacterium]|nr:hypothetical protein [Acidimicrobiales bacterium]
MANATSPARPASLPGSGTPDADWPAQAADAIERAVGTVRDKTTGPALKVARAAVYGLFAGLVGAAALVLALLFLVRIIDSYLPDAVFGDDHMWATYLIIGLLFVIVGAVVWSQRQGPREDVRAPQR